MYPWLDHDYFRRRGADAESGGLRDPGPADWGRCPWMKRGSPSPAVQLGAPLGRIGLHHSSGGVLGLIAAPPLVSSVLRV